jgi:tetratricopeptide (TPR) repeat protein
MRLTRLVYLALVNACLLLVPSAISQHQHSAGDLGKFGSVNFPISCDASVQVRFNRAVAILHSFGYEKAAEAFTEVAEADPVCGMAYWGLAMTYYHPVWEAPNPTALKQGWAAVENAKSAGAKTQRERDYIAAIEVFYKDSAKLDHRTRSLAYETAMGELQARYPDDREAAIFYALAVRGNALPSDKTYASQLKAGAILEKAFAEQPEHPGLAHYIIHCYDYPSLADRALVAARRYAKIAPDSPHALHMPSHIFTRLGYWQESIESNLASAAAAQKDGVAGEQLHAMDYMVYAYLQGAQDLEVTKLIESMPSPRQSDPTYFAALYSTASMPARYAVERHRWAEAAAIAMPKDIFPGGRYAWTEANIYFARALGATRTGGTEAARKSLQQLTSLRDTMVQANDKYWAEQLDIQREIVTAWLAWAEGKHEDALRQMRSAADHEDSTDKHSVTPGVILPARELLGEMLLEAKQPAQALGEFETTLRTSPNRFNALAGAALSATLSGNPEKAKSYYARLVATCDHADADRPELETARKYLAKG